MTLTSFKNRISILTLDFLLFFFNFKELSYRLENSSDKLIRFQKLHRLIADLIFFLLRITLFVVKLPIHNVSVKLSQEQLYKFTKLALKTGENVLLVLVALKA